MMNLGIDKSAQNTLYFLGEIFHLKKNAVSMWTKLPIYFCQPS